MLSEKRDKSADKAFFVKSIGSNGLPETVTIDKSGANKAGLDEINRQLIVLFLLIFSLIQITLRQIKYLNNIVEQDHRGIKKITKPMMSFKAFHAPESTIAGITENLTIFEQFYGLAA